MSSAPLLAGVIGGLGAKYNVLVKPHDLADPAWREDYRGLGGVRLVEDADITRYMYAADLLISDFSSTIYEYAQLFRPIVAFVAAPEKMAAKAHDVSWWSIARQVYNREEVAPAVDELLDGKWRPGREHRERVAAVFACRDGRAGARAAAAIREWEEDGT